MKTVSLGMDAEYLAVRLWKGRPWTSDVAVERRDRSGVRLPWPRAPRLEFAGGITLNFALTTDGMSAMASGSLTAAQVDGLIAAGSPSVDLADPVTGRVWASGRWAAAYGAGSGGSGLIPTDGQTVVIVSNTITPVGGGGTGGVTPQQVQSMIDSAPYAPTSHTHDSRYVRTVNGTGPDGAGNVTVSGGGSVSDATTTTKGIVQLAGDLAGTAAAPTVPGLAGKVDNDDARLSDARTPTAHTHDDRYYTEAEVDALIAGVPGGGGSGPLALYTGLPSSPVQWQPYEYRVTDDTTYSASIQWASGAPAILGWGIVVLVWDGTTWRGEWVEMTTSAPAGPGEITPMEPTFTDPSGTVDDRYVIPAQEGVEYLKGGTPITAGTYTPTAGEAVAITAQPATGYSFPSGVTTSWSHTFSTDTGNTAPSMTLGTPTITGLEVTQPFTTSDVDGDTVTVTAAWGDGATGTVTSPASHTYASVGTYDATFTPNDGTVDGAVRNAQFVLSAGPPPVGNPATLQQALLDYGALGYWKLDETTGTTMSDSSGNGRHLTLAGTPTTDYELAGKDGRLHLKTASASVGDLTGTALSIPAGGHLTVFALIHMLGTGGGPARRLVSKRASNQGEWGLLIHSRAPQSMVWRAVPSIMLSYSTSAENLPANAWNAVATVIPRDTEQRPVIYINSGTPVSVTSGSGLGTTGDGTAPFRIGDGFIGAVGHVAVMPHNLTGAHIQKLVDLAVAEGLA